MYRMKMDKKSIIYKVTTLVIILIVAQTVLLSVFLILGGVLSQAKKNAYASFSEKVINRKEYLQREMSVRWTNMDPYLEQIRAKIAEKKEPKLLFDDISSHIISIMRSTQATGAFLILNQGDEKQEYPSLYFRDYDPVLNDYDNKDLYMVFGPAEIANRLQIPLDQMWKYKIPLAGMNRDFFDEPVRMAALSDYSNLLGYWSLPFRLFEEDISVITYTEPLLSKDKEVIGVIGVEISAQYFNQFLPPTDLQARDSLGYFIGYRENRNEKLEPILFTRAIQGQLLKQGESFSYKKVASEKNIYLLDKNYGFNDVYLCIEKMDLYNDNTPFQEEQWYIIGMMSGNSLLSYANKIRNIILISLLSSIVVGIVGGYAISYRFTRPVILLAKKVKNSDFRNKFTLEETGLAEVDELSLAIQAANDSLLESTIKMSRIIDLAGLPIGAFEYREGSNYVLVTEQLMSILDLLPEEMPGLLGDKHLFKQKVKELLCMPEAGEDHVYFLPGLTSKWVKLKEVSTDRFTVGVVTDVTEEILEKKNIIRERDYDYLTQIYNRNALHRRGEELLTNRHRGMEAAVFMCDLDNLKAVNDAYGHEWGDIYIKLAVKHMNLISEDRKMLGRRSGDEFVIMLYDFQSREEIQNCIENFYRRLGEDPLRLPDHLEKIVSISFGLVWVNDYELTFDDYLMYADRALYYAKKNKKGSCCEYGVSSEMDKLPAGAVNGDGMFFL